jgi:hypothetical protein
LRKALETAARIVPGLAVAAAVMLLASMVAQ